MTLRPLASYLACALLSACASKTETVAPTYWQDVAPLFAEHCVSCHREGGIAPMRLDQYAPAKRFAELIAEATRTRTMPPWGATSDGSCGEFRDSLALSDDEIALIGTWVHEGAQEGTPREISLPRQPMLRDATELKTPEFAPVVQGGELAAHDEYRCFPLDAQLDAAQFITGYEVVPGQAEIVHHVIVNLVTLDSLAEDGSGHSNAEVMRLLDEQSPDREGWPCFTGAGDGVKLDATLVGGHPDKAWSNTRRTVGSRRSMDKC